jgi:hypothetical protein
MAQQDDQHEPLKKKEFQNHRQRQIALSADEDPWSMITNNRISPYFSTRDNDVDYFHSFDDKLIVRSLID